MTYLVFKGALQKRWTTVECSRNADLKTVTVSKCILIKVKLQRVDYTKC